MEELFIVSPRDLQALLDELGAGLDISKELVDGMWHVTVRAVEHAPPTDLDDDQVEDRTETPDGGEKLGSLSAKFESGSLSTAAIGNDSTGGFSYGKYQIATKTGTFAEFMKFLSREFPNLHASLEGAGGTSAAKAGATTFKAKWKELAGSAPLQEAEHAYIKASHFDRFVVRLNDIGLHVSRRSRALQNVIWSVAVQHGPKNSVVKAALDPLGDPDTLTDKKVIEEIYKERSNVNKWFSRSTAAVKKSVKNRFKEEKKRALEMLKDEENA